jgi:hypothetical protein
MVDNESNAWRLRPGTLREAITPIPHHCSNVELGRIVFAIRRLIVKACRADIRQPPQRTPVEPEAEGCTPRYRWDGIVLFFFEVGEDEHGIQNSSFGHVDLLSRAFLL